MYKCINEFKKGYQPHACVIKKDDGTIVADTTDILTLIVASTDLLGFLQLAVQCHWFAYQLSEKCHIL